MKDKSPRFFVFIDFAVFFYCLIFVALAALELFADLAPVSNETVRRVSVLIFLGGVAYFFVRVFFSIFLPKGSSGWRGGRGESDKA